MERLGFNHQDNLISYNVGPFTLSINTTDNKIVILNHSSFIEDMQPLLDTMSEILSLEKDNITIISTQEAHITYTIEILNKYLDYIFITM